MNASKQNPTIPSGYFHLPTNYASRPKNSGALSSEQRNTIISDKTLSAAERYNLLVTQTSLVSKTQEDWLTDQKIATETTQILGNQVSLLESTNQSYDQTDEEP